MGNLQVPQVDAITSRDPNLQLAVKPVGLGITADPSGEHRRIHLAEERE